MRIMKCDICLNEIKEDDVSNFILKGKEDSLKFDICPLCYINLKQLFKAQNTIDKSVILRYMAGRV